MVQHHSSIVSETAGAEDHRLPGLEACLRSLGGRLHPDDLFAFVAHDPAHPVVQEQGDIMRIGPCLELADQLYAEAKLPSDVLA